MKKFIRIFVCFLLMVALGVNAVAESASRRVFEIDFDFVVRNESFPAGRYSIERLNPANPEILVLRQIGGKAKAVLLIRTTGDSKSGDQFSLRFKNSGDKYVLVGIWGAGKKYALDAEFENKRRDSRRPAEFLSFDLSPDISGAAEKH